MYKRQLAAYVGFDPEEAGVTELVFYPVLADILEKAGDMGEDELKAEIRRHIHDLIPKHITKEEDVYKRQDRRRSRLPEAAEGCLGDGGGKLLQKMNVLQGAASLGDICQDLQLSLIHIFRDLASAALEQSPVTVWRRSVRLTRSSATNLPSLVWIRLCGSTL